MAAMHLMNSRVVALVRGVPKSFAKVWHVWMSKKSGRRTLHFQLTATAAHANTQAYSWQSSLTLLDGFE